MEEEDEKRENMRTRRRRLLGVSGSFLKASWGPLGGFMGPFMGPLGRPLGASWAVLKGSWPADTFGGRFGRPLSAVLRPSWSNLRPSWGVLGSPLGDLGVLFGRLGAPLEASKAVLELAWRHL